MKRIIPALLFLSFSLSVSLKVHAGFFDTVNKVLGTNTVSKTNLTATGLAGAALSDDKVVGGLKEALGKGVEKAVSSLGKTDGFLTNLNVKIPLPEKLKTVESGLRLAGYGQYADDFITSMNRAAEQAVPTAAAVFGDSIKQMSIADAKSILSSTNDAATQYFRRTTTTNLQAKFLPLVSKATDAVGVTAKYKAMTSKLTAADSLGGLFGKKTPAVLSQADVDAYVTDKAMDGLFKMVAEQEKEIRANPVARTTDLLKQVFGTTTK